jgi:hypothetical protein
MGAKDDAFNELEKVIDEFKLAPSTVGREIASDPGFMARLADPAVDIQTKTLDRVWRFILRKRGQLELDLD